MLSDLGLEHYEMIKEINRMPFEIPKLDSPLYFSKKGVFRGEGLVAAGFLKLTSEAILVVDQDLGRLERARLISILLNEMIEELKRFGLDDVHVFLSDDDGKTEKLISKHFSFQPAKGKAMVMFNG